MPSLDDQIVMLLRDTIVNAKGAGGLDLIDTLRSLYNSGFSPEQVRQALNHANPTVRQLSKKFLDQVEELRRR